MTTGQTMSVYLNVLNFKDLGCREVLLEGVLNNKVIKTYNIKSGIDTLKTPGGEHVFCNNGNAGDICNFIIP
jgi:hypothetical protein